jgi:hypothetical protein
MLLLVRSIALVRCAAHRAANTCRPVGMENLTTEGIPTWARLLPAGAAVAAPAMEERACPAILLISDGMLTDDYKPALGRFSTSQWGASVRMAVGIGRMQIFEVLERFIGSSSEGVLTANNPEQLVRMIRWASTHASRLASNLIPASQTVSPLTGDDISSSAELIW